MRLVDRNRVKFRERTIRYVKRIFKGLGRKAFSLKRYRDRFRSKLSRITFFFLESIRCGRPLSVRWNMTFEKTRQTREFRNNNVHYRRPDTCALVCSSTLLGARTHERTTFRLKIVNVKSIRNTKSGHQLIV